MKPTSSVHTHGKCILAGEHSVVRGGEALVLPLRSRSLELSWQPAETKSWQIEAGAFATPFRDSLNRGLEITGFKLPQPGYGFRITSNIPVQAGLGSSAALAVAVVRFLNLEGALLRNPFELAIEIENLFHGKSSGIDVACVLSTVPIRYVKNSPPENLPVAWKPLLYLFDTGMRSSTKTCVEKVEQTARKDLDNRMEQAVQQVKSALLSEQADRLSKLAEGMNLAATCFEEWGLGADSLSVEKLLAAGALSVKPTGSGGSGFLLSLWPMRPPADLKLIPVWEVDSSAAP